MTTTQPSTPRSLPAGTMVTLSCGARVKLMHATLIEDETINEKNYPDLKAPCADGDDKGEY